MISLGRRQLRKNIIFTLRYLINQDSESSKIQTVSFKNNAINDFSKISYQPQQKLQFVNGKTLVYKNERSFFRVLGESLMYLMPMIGIGYTIYINPFADIFPAAIPILAVLELIIAKLWLNRIKWNQNIVKQIYLLQNGEATQIWYANQVKRRLFGQQLKKIYYNSIFVNPNFQQQEVILLDKDHRVFPLSLKQVQAQKYGYAWVKHFSNGDNFLIIPKNAGNMNLQVLIEIFKGKVIKNKIK